ncbi:MAG: acyl-CoA thioesterase [Bdellovibrionales bacterium]
MDYREHYEFLKYEKSYQIRESYLDTLGHVNNASYIQLFEEARWDLVEEGGYGLSKVLELKVSPVILDLDCKFAREVLNREQVRIETQVTEYKGMVGNIHQELFKENGKLACIANFKFGMFDLNSRKLVPPSELWLNAIARKK